MRSPVFRLVLLYCVLLLVLGASFAWFTIRSFEHYMSTTIVREIGARSGEIWQTAKDRLDDRRQLAEIMELRFAPAAQDHFIRISEGSLELYRSGIPEGTDIPALEAAESRAPVAGGDLHLLRFGSLFLVSRIYTMPGGRIAVESGQSNLFAEGVEHSLTQSLFFGLPILLVFAALGGYILMRRALRPIELMIDAAEAITFNDPGNRLPLAQTGDRIETLGLALNRMLDRLDNAYQQANRFSVDAAHELRTPLAIVRGELELIALKDAAPEQRAALQNILDEANRLSELVENLGMLSRVEGLGGKNTECDLHAIVQDTMEQMRLLAEEDSIALVPLTGSAAVVTGDKSRLKQVIVNLLDNAIKYTTRGGSIAVDVRPLANRARLTVTDTGIGIAPEHRDRIFDRFYRISADRGETGSGIGLSIVKSICNAHGGTVEVESTPGVGSTFRVELPLSTGGKAQ
jgi:signal transduction histidine kinase